MLYHVTHNCISTPSVIENLAAFFRLNSFCDFRSVFCTSFGAMPHQSMSGYTWEDVPVETCLEATPTPSDIKPSLYPYIHVPILVKPILLVPEVSILLWKPYKYKKYINEDQLMVSADYTFDKFVDVLQGRPTCFHEFRVPSRYRHWFMYTLINCFAWLLCLVLLF